MDGSFWRQRWADGRIGFHAAAANHHLLAHADRFLPETGGRVLVPLCGKTVDLTWLSERGHDVVGVELVESAAVAYFAEAGHVPTVADIGPYTAYSHGRVTILVGDFLALTPAILGPVTHIYDRAAMIALPPAMRVRFVEVMRQHMTPGVTLLLLTMTYDQAALPGPPHSVDTAEVMLGYADGCTVELLAQGDAESMPPRFAAHTVTTSDWLVTAGPARDLR